MHFGTRNKTLYKVDLYDRRVKSFLQPKHVEKSVKEHYRNQFAKKRRRVNKTYVETNIWEEYVEAL